MKAKYKAFLFLTLGVVGLCFCFVFSTFNYKKTVPEEAYAYLQQKFLEKEKTLHVYLDSICEKKITNVSDLLDFCSANAINEGEFAFYMYHNSILKLWSSNVINIPSALNQHLKNNRLLILEHDFVYVVSKNVDSLSYVGIYILKKRGTPDYDFFTSDYFYDNDVSQPIDISIEEGQYSIYNREGTIVFSVIFPDEIKIADVIAAIELIAWIVSFAFLYFGIYWLLLLLPFFNRDKNRIWILLAVVIILITNIFSIFKIPDSLYSSNIFSSYYYASYFRSLGELFIKSFSLIFLVLLIKNCFSIDMYKFKHKISKKLVGYFLIMSAFVFYISVFIFQYSIANDSIITISPLLLYNYNLLSIIVLFSICSLFWALLIGFEKLLEESMFGFETTKPYLRALFICVSFTIGIVTVVYVYFFTFEYVYFMYLLAFLLFVLLVNLHFFYPKTISIFVMRVLACGIFGFLVFFITENTNSKKNEKYKEDFAEIMLMNENPLMVYDLSNTGQAIQSDKQIINFLANPVFVKDSIIEYINTQYLEKYTGTYMKNISVSFFSSPNDTMQINNQTEKFQNANYFSDDAYVGYLNMSRGRALYMMKNKIVFSSNNKIDTALIFIELEASFKFQKPLLNIKPHRIEKEIAQFTYAEYENNVLKTYQETATPYKLSLKAYQLDTIYNGLRFVSDGYVHTVYISSPKKTLLVSEVNAPIAKQLSSVSFIFLIIVFYSIIPIIIDAFFGKKLPHVSFRVQIQRMVVFLLLGSSLIGGYLFVQYTLSANKIERINNAMYRMNFFTDFILSFQNDTCLTSYNKNQEILPLDLSKMISDNIPAIIIYNLEGEQITLKDENSFFNKNEHMRINPYVIKSILHECKTTYIEEKVLWGNKYSVLYKPMRNQKGEIIAYISYSSLAKDARVDHQLTGFFSTFLSFYGLFILLAVLLGAFITRYMSLSLAKISTHLAKINLQSVNQKIEWKYEDEIGQLIQQYNRLIDELEMSAELLSRTERETAWKNMAQQIAHEIKNPLTPMKLRTQQIQREIMEGNVDTEKLKQYINMLLTQIDILNDITTSLSTLDNIHHADGEKENLLDIIDNLLMLHANQKQYEIQFINLSNTNEVFVFIEKTQLIRAFNNLIRNAIQAKKEDEKQKIIIELCDYGEQMWQIKVQDFGIGMDESTLKHAFTAYFSTKSSGMGLGLLMVKNIINDWNGTIQIESVLNEGTTFIILLPKYSKKINKMK